ncbi:MAG: hypothetical protein JW779_05340 [Candidatus Thorarchaeota archaeon]|nr:hypothetical protein [Candidatus Thorarchaeota archaeon]
MILMHGFEILQELAHILTGEELIVSSNGNISRQVYHYLPRPQIYLRGSMGLPISIGLGVAVAKPEKQVLVIVGDGNLLMGLGALATCSFVNPKNMKILILDNNEYATTGHQKTSARILNYPKLLDGFDIKSIEPIMIDESTEGVRVKLEQLLQATQLYALPAMIGNESPVLSNIPLHPEEITKSLK